MASKSHVDDSVIERRLRPIYDWLDNGNNKKAIQEADKVLRKQPKLQCASVLKALALLRLGKNDDCSELISAVVSEGTADDATLQALTICYREMHQPELICLMYEKASKLDPTNEDIISHLFMAYVRVGNYKKQQQTAMQLYKLKPKNPYYFWAIMSIVMQSHVTKDATSKKVSLQLAERMIQKFVKEDKIESEAEVLTYLYILEIQEKYQEALSVIDGPLAKRIVQQPHNFLPMKKALYSTHLQKYEAASLIYMNLILNEPDNWQHYVNFTNIILSMWKKFIQCPERKSNPLLEASKFLRDTREKAVNEGGLNRSPFMGLLQLALKLKEEELSDQIGTVCGKITEDIYNYVKNFGDKMCCYSDIVNFLPLIPKDDVQELLTRIEALVLKDSSGIPVDIKNIYRHQIWYQLRRALQEQITLDIDKEIELADELVNFYVKTAHFSADMAPTDIRPNDTYLIMAAHAYFSVVPHLVTKVVDSEGEGKLRATSIVTNLVIKLCCLLEHGINISNANFQLKLLLIKAFKMIGASNASFRIYEKLDLKQIQMDTLGHILAHHTVDMANYPIASSIFSTTLKFFMANYKDTSDPLIMSYKYGSLSRIPEFVEFRERLNKSLHFATVTAEQMILELTIRANSKSNLEDVMKQLDIDPANEKTNWDELRDNRDLYVMNTWEPEEGRVKIALKEETFRDEVCMLRLRNLVLRIIAASFSLRKSLSKSPLNNLNNNFSNKGRSAMVNGESNGTCDNSTTTVLRELIDTLRSHNETCDKYRLSKPPQIPLQGPDVPRIYLYAKGYHIPCILKYAELVLKIYDCTEGSDGLDSWSGDILKHLLENFEKLRDFHLRQLDALQVTASTALPGVNPQPLAHVSHFIQTISVILIFLECCNSLLLPLKSLVTKKGKKKKASNSVPEIISHFNNFVGSFHYLLQQVDNALSEKLNALKKDGESSSVNGFSPEMFNDALLPDLNPSAVCKSIQQSYTLSLVILNSEMKSKLKFTNSLKV